ncbi:hypothetical protein Tco_0458757 [Tanacetum coccineum]
MDNTLSMAEDDTDLVLETYSGEHDPADGVSVWFIKGAWKKVMLLTLDMLLTSWWVKVTFQLPIPPRKRKMSGKPKGKKKKHPSEANESNSKKVSRFGRTITCSNCYKKGHNKTGCTSKKVDPPPNEVRSKGKKGSQSGFESAVSALKRMRMDVNGSGQNEEEHTNAHMEEPVQEEQPANDGPANIDEPANVEPILRRGAGLRWWEYSMGVDDSYSNWLHWINAIRLMPKVKDMLEMPSDYYKCEMYNLIQQARRRKKQKNTIDNTKIAKMGNDMHLLNTELMIMENNSRSVERMSCSSINCHDHHWQVVPLEQVLPCVHWHVLPFEHVLPLKINFFRCASSLIMPFLIAVATSYGSSKSRYLFRVGFICLTWMLFLFAFGLA